MELQLNGETRTFPEGISVVDLIVELDLSGRRIAVECNREIIHILAAGDVVEVVQFVGGG